MIRPFLQVDHDYGDFSLTLHSFVCRPGPDTGTPPNDSDRAWVGPEELGIYNLLPPDRVIARALLRARSAPDA